MELRDWSSDVCSSDLTKNLAPRYDQRSFRNEKKNEIELLVSGDEADGSLHINQDAYVSRAILDEDREIEYALKHPLNGIYIFVIKGSMNIASHNLTDRDALGVWNTKSVLISANEKSELLIFEVPMQATFKNLTQHPLIHRIPHRGF